MKKILFFTVLAGMLLGPALAVARSRPVDPVLPGAWTEWKASAFVKLHLRDFTRLSDHKLSLKEKIGFVILKKQLKRELKKHPDLLVKEYMAQAAKISTGAWIAIILAVALVITIIVVSSIDFNYGWGTW
ncbi:MAG: hypothetical protein RJA57_659 [Bacteroidota bacterium]|jgi:hypothetical protein